MTSCRPSRVTSSPSFGDTTGTHGRFRVFRRHRVSNDGPGVGNPVSPAGISSVETAGSPKFLGDPNHPFAHAPRLRRDGTLQTGRRFPRRVFFRATAWPLLRERQRLSRGQDFRSSITWLSDSLSTLRHAGYLTQRKTRFRPLVKRYRTGFPPAGSQSKVSNSHHVNPPPPPSFLAQSPFLPFLSRQSCWSKSTYSRHPSLRTASNVTDHGAATVDSPLPIRPTSPLSCIGLFSA